MVCIQFLILSILKILLILSILEMCLGGRYFLRVAAKNPVFGRLMLLACGLIAFFFWWLQFTPYLDPTNDAGRYMVLGVSFARTGELRLVNAPNAPLDTLYPPGFPAIIAFWLRATSGELWRVVAPMKITQLFLLIGTLGLLQRFLRRTNLPIWYQSGALLTAAFCPALTAYADQVMSEIPFLFFCLASVLFAEIDLRKEETGGTLTTGRVAGALLCASCAYLIRSAGIALFLALIVWFAVLWWKARKGTETHPNVKRDYLVAALAMLIIVVGGWQWRTRTIVRSAPPGVRYPTYTDQFTLRDIYNEKAGRITLTPWNIILRAEDTFPTYIGMIPRAVLHNMSPKTGWGTVFYVVAIPLGALILQGFVLAWRRGMLLSCVFSAVFWAFAALWPWQGPRFLLPIVPFFLVFGAMGAEWLGTRLTNDFGARFASVTGALGFGLLLIYCVHVQYFFAAQEYRPVLPEYTLGRTPEEAGFYAACFWLRDNAPPGAVIMGRPAYLLYLYSAHPTTQIEPTVKTHVQEASYIQKRRVAYLVEDTWSWSHSEDYLAPYLKDYGDRWTLAWQDKSGVKVWKRLVVGK